MDSLEQTGSNENSQLPSPKVYKNRFSKVLQQLVIKSPFDVEIG